MIKHILQTLFALVVVVLCAQYLLAEPESDYPFNKKLSDHNREVISEAMEIVKKECPYLATLDWAALPTAYEIDLDEYRRAGKPVLYSEIGISRKGDLFFDLKGDMAERGWDKDVSVSVDTDVNITSFIVGLGAGNRPGIRGIYHPKEMTQYRGAAECNLALVDGKYYFRDVPALSILEKLE